MTIKIEKKEEVHKKLVVIKTCDECGKVEEGPLGADCVDKTPWICNVCDNRRHSDEAKIIFSKLIGATVISFSQDIYGSLSSIVVKTTNGHEVEFGIEFHDEII